VADGDLSDGHNEDGSTNNDQATDATFGSLVSLVSFGADQTIDFSLSDAADDLNALPTLFSLGDAVDYSVSGDTLTASTVWVEVGGTGLNANGVAEEDFVSREVFTLTVNSDGTWLFDLNDQLDHVDDGTNTENSDLLTALDGSTSVASIDFSHLIVTTDSDGDSNQVLLANDFAVTTTCRWRPGRPPGFRSTRTSWRSPTAISPTASPTATARATRRPSRPPPCRPW
jgi:hypothetical protein